MTVQPQKTAVLVSIAYTGSNPHTEVFVADMAAGRKVVAQFARDHGYYIAKGASRSDTLHWNVFRNAAKTADSIVGTAWVKEAEVDQSRAHVLVTDRRTDGEPIVGGGYIDGRDDSDDLAIQFTDIAAAYWLGSGHGSKLEWTAPSKLTDAQAWKPEAGMRWDALRSTLLEQLNRGRNATTVPHSERFAVTTVIPECDYCASRNLVSAWQNFRDADDRDADDIAALTDAARAYTGEPGDTHDEWEGLSRCQRCAGPVRGRVDESADYAAGRWAQALRDRAPRAVQLAAQRVYETVAPEDYADTCRVEQLLHGAHADLDIAGETVRVSLSDFRPAQGGGVATAVAGGHKLGKVRIMSRYGNDAHMAVRDGVNGAKLHMGVWDVVREIIAELTPDRLPAILAAAVSTAPKFVKSGRVLGTHTGRSVRFTVPVSLAAYPMVGMGPDWRLSVHTVDQDGSNDEFLGDIILGAGAKSDIGFRILTTNARGWDRHDSITAAAQHLANIRSRQVHNAEPVNLVKAAVEYSECGTVNEVQHIGIPAARARVADARATKNEDEEKNGYSWHTFEEDENGARYSLDGELYVTVHYFPGRISTRFRSAR